VTAVVALPMSALGRLINMILKLLSLCSTAWISFDQIGKTTAVHAYATNTQN
jgi:hypothetical protein